MCTHITRIFSVLFTHFIHFFPSFWFHSSANSYMLLFVSSSISIFSVFPTSFTTVRNSILFHICFFCYFYFFNVLCLLFLFFLIFPFIYVFFPLSFFILFFLYFFSLISYQLLPKSSLSFSSLFLLNCLQH